MKQRLVLSLLSVIALLVYALPELPLHTGGLAGVFAAVWLTFCLIAFGGNMAGLLYRQKRRGVQKSEVTQKKGTGQYKRGTSI